VKQLSPVVFITNFFNVNSKYYAHLTTEYDPDVMSIIVLASLVEGNSVDFSNYSTFWYYRSLDCYMLAFHRVGLGSAPGDSVIRCIRNVTGAVSPLSFLSSSLDSTLISPLL
jgi:hypothetical protein